MTEGQGKSSITPLFQSGVIMMLLNAIGLVILRRQLSRNLHVHEKFLNIKHDEVAQNQFLNLHLHKKLIKSHNFMF